jgi:glycosyltransferase involved in cell wall biosynthesis
MRLAIITSGYLPSLDGVSISVHERLRRLSAWGHHVLVIAPSYEGAAQYFPNWRTHIGNILPHVRVEPVPSGSFAGVAWERNPRPAARKCIDTLLEDFRPDAIHVDEPERLAAGLLCCPGKAYARRHNIPVVAFYHTNFIDYAPDYMRGVPRSIVSLAQAAAARVIAAIYNGYDATLVPAESSRRKLEAFGVRNLRPGIYNGVDTTRFNPALRSTGYFQREWGLANLDDRRVLLFVGRLAPDKGWPLLIRALPRVSATLSNRVAVVIAGDGELREPVERALRGRVPHLHLLGRVGPDRMLGLMANATLHVTASEKENSPLTVIEAFASATPVVGPQAAGVGELVEDRVNGRLYPPGDERALEHVLLELAEDDAKLAILQRGALKTGRQRDWDVTTRNWFDAIQRCGFPSVNSKTVVCS